MVRVLVTGANGFVGRHLVELLSRQPDIEIYAGVHRRDEVANDMEENYSLSVIPFELGEEVSIRDLVHHAKPDQTYHLAGISKTFGVSTEDYFRINSLGTYHLGKHLLDTCGTNTRMLFISSASVYGSKSHGLLSESDPIKPSSEYGSSKASAESFLWPLLAKGLDVVVARPFNHTGLGQTRGFVCADLVYRLKESISITNDGDIPRMKVGKLHTVRDFLDVRDVVNAYNLIMKINESGIVINVSSGKGISVEEILYKLVHKVALISDIHLLPLHEQISRMNEDSIIGDSSFLRDITSWNPTYSIMDSLMDLWGPN